MKVYIIGSLRGKEVETVSEAIRGIGHVAFDDWYAAGPLADDEWQRYSNARGQSYKEALAGPAAQHVFNFDKHNLDTSDAAVLVMPAGKSAHLELGYCAGMGKRTYVLFNAVPERYDVMYNFATAVCFSLDELLEELKK